MSDQISAKRPAAMEEAERVFSHYDADGDGKITGPELKTAVRALSPNSTSGEVVTMMDAMDANHDGTVDLKEFSAFLRAGDDRPLRDAFDLYDADHNGLISAEELHLVLKQLGDSCSLKDCHRMIGSVDADGDGSVNFDEFKRMMAGGPPTPSG